MNCRGCGVHLDPTQEQINATLDRVLETSLKDAQSKEGVCPLCAHSKAVPYSNRKTVLFGLLLACLAVGTALLLGMQRSRQTERAVVAQEALARIVTQPNVTSLIGKPISMGPGLQGEIKRDETGWQEAHITMPIRGPNGDGIVHLVGGRGTGPWVFTTFEIDFEKQHKKADLVSGQVVEHDPNAYVDVHTQSAAVPEYSNAVAAAPRFNGDFPCVFAWIVSDMMAPKFGQCSMPTTRTDPADLFETDLRYGSFVLRETDLCLDDVSKVPLTRSYSSADWLARNPVHAFGRNSNHPFDITPLGSRNPYTYQMIVLEDGDFLYFDRISKGTGYADAVFQHTETSTHFYKATTGWNGNGWTTKLADGSEIRFPESYNGKSLAQGSPTEMIDPQGNRLELRRDAQRNLQEIRTPHGHWIRFAYDSLSRIKRAEDDAGHWARYEYNADGMLETATHSSGRQRHCEYEGTLMIRITDEKKRVMLRNWFESRVLKKQEFGSGWLFSYEYQWPNNQYYPDRVVVTLPDHTKRVVRVAATVPEYMKKVHS